MLRPLHPAATACRMKAEEWALRGAGWHAAAAAPGGGGLQDEGGGVGPQGRKRALARA